MRHSGLQREVLKLYRHCLRAASRKPPETRSNFEYVARRDFLKYLDHDRKDFATIELLLRTGWRKLEAYSMDSVKDIH